MSTPRHRLPLLALCMMAAALVLSISAASAQAGEFRINGKTFKEAGISEAELSGGFGKLTLAIEPEGLNATVHCRVVHFDRWRWNPLGFWERANEGLECTTLNAACTINRDGPEEGLQGAILFEMSGEIVLHGGEVYETSESAEFGTIYFSGPKCTLPEENPLQGSIAFALPNALEELSSQTISDISQATEELLGVALFFGTHRTFIELEGSGSFHLTGAHEGALFGAE